MSNVLHLAEYGHGGGAESVFRDTIIELRNNDTVNQHLVACKKRGNELFDINYDFGQRPENRLAQIFSVANYRFFKDVLEDCSPGIIHIQNYGNLSPSILKAIYEYKKANRVKVIQTVHTFEYACSHYAAFDYRKNESCLDCANKRYKFKIFYRGCSRLGYLHSWAKGITSLIGSYYIKKDVIDSWLTPSNFLKMCMELGGIEEKKIQVVRNPMNNVFSKLRYDSKLGKRHNFTVTYFGRFSHEKNIEALIDAFHILLKKNNTVKLLLIGDGECKESLVAKCEEVGILSSVEFIGFLPIDLLIQTLTKAHVAVIASKCFETASLVINEAVMCNLVPLVANHGAMKETGEITKASVFFNNNDPQDLAEKLVDLMCDYNFFFRKLQYSMNIIRNIYNPNSYATRLLELYFDDIKIANGDIKFD